MAETIIDYKICMGILKRIDPHINNILQRIDKVSLYSFCGLKNKWENNGIEGEFFICSRDIEPYCSLNILNHETKNFFTEFIPKDWDWKQDEPLLLYRKDNTVFGVEFYNIDDYIKITTLIKYTIYCVNQPREPIFKQKLSSARLMHFLNEVQDFGKETTSMKTQYTQLQPLTSKPNINEYVTNQEKNTIFNASTDIKEIENLASTLSLIEKSANQELITSNTFELKDKKKEAVLEEEKPEPLDRQQLQQAVMYLMKNDSDFIKKLHETYIKSCMNLI